VTAKRIYDVLTQLGSLLRAEARLDTGLQPVHLQVLNYLSICNRYSDTPAAVADYVGLTKGTVSQTLRVLAERGFVEKQGDPDDGRLVHLRLTREGRAVVKDAVPPAVLVDAVMGLGRREQQETLDTLLALLRGVQQANEGLSFGVCDTCTHFRDEGGAKFRCGLTGEPLSVADSNLICREHLALEH